MIGRYCEKERGKLSGSVLGHFLKSLLMMLLPYIACSLAENNKLDLGSCLISSACAVTYIGIGGDYFHRVPMSDMACCAICYWKQCYNFRVRGNQHGSMEQVLGKAKRCTD